MTQGRRIERYVAIGDSQTEGLHDYDRLGEPRGWADRFAEALAERHPGLQYANLAVRGKRTAEIRRAQLGPALALEPDLVTVVSGVNDVVRPRVDLAPVVMDIEAMIARLRESGAAVMTCTFPIPRVGLTKRVGPRLRALNTCLREIAAKHDVLVVEMEDVEMAVDLRLWSPDRIHLNPDGHARLGAAFARVWAGDPPETWQAPLPPAPVPSTAVRAVRELAWLATYLTPKLGRMVLGRSSGDGRVAKRPDLRPVEETPRG